MIKNKKKSAINYIIWFFISFIIILVIIGYFFVYNVEEQKIKSWFAYLNNQTVSVLIGFIGIFAGYQLGYYQWIEKHKIELNDKYFAEYIGYVFQFYAIKQKEIDLRFGKNRQWWNFAKIIINDNKENTELDKDKLMSDTKYLYLDSTLEQLDKLRIENDGRIESTIYQLKKIYNTELEDIERIHKEFEDDFKEFTKYSVADEHNPNKTTKECEYRAYVDCINKNLDKSKKKIERIVKL